MWNTELHHLIVLNIIIRLVIDTATNLIRSLSNKV